jgi:hypothetical protein
MVPAGKTALCLEYYCFDEDSLLSQTDEQFAQDALEDCHNFHLGDGRKCIDHLVLRFAGADASQNRHNWLSKARLGLLEDLRSFRNLYYINRTDLDIATLAGLESAEAILSGNRADFDRHIDPTQIGIRSQRKVFEFKVPAESNRNNVTGRTMNGFVFGPAFLSLLSTVNDITDIIAIS